MLKKRKRESLNVYTLKTIWKHEKFQGKWNYNLVLYVIREEMKLYYKFNLFN